MKSVFYHKNLQAGGAERVLLEIFSQFTALSVDARILLGREIGPMMSEAVPEWLIKVPTYRPTLIERVLRKARLLSDNFPERMFHRSVRDVSKDLAPANRELFLSAVMQQIPVEAIYRLRYVLLHEKPKVLFSSLVETGHVPVLLAIASLKPEHRRMNWVAVEHNNTIARIKDYYKDEAERSLWIEVTKLVYQRCSHVVAVSEGVKDGLIENFAVEPSKISVIYNPVPIARIESIAGSLDSQGYILSAGRLHSQKRQSDLIRAFAKVKDRIDKELWIAGDGVEEDQLIALAQRLEVSDRVQFLGVRNDIWQLMKCADALVLTSAYEGFGMVLTEAMAAGCPVVSYDVDYGPREFIKDGSNGRLVRSGDVDGLSTALVDVCSDRQNSQRMAAQARTDVQQFDSLNVAKAYSGIVESYS